MERYVITKRLTSTRFCDVYAAKFNDSDVALKVVDVDDERPPHNSRDEVRLLEEVKGHPNIAEMLDTQTKDLTEKVLVFPLYRYTLIDLLRSHSKNRKRFNPYLIGTRSAEQEYSNNLDLSASKQIIKGIANGLAFLHSKKIIHRDIKPANIMFASSGFEPIIIDFGISYKYPTNFGKEQPDKKICDVSTGVYKAPELLFGITDYSYGVDIWALGVLMTLVFSDNLQPLFEEEDVVDFRLVGMVFRDFGVPTLNSWPEAAKSPTFSRLLSEERPPAPTKTVLPRADNATRSLFQNMMVFSEAARLTASQIYSQI